MFFSVRICVPEYSNHCYSTVKFIHRRRLIIKSTGTSCRCTEGAESQGGEGDENQNAKSAGLAAEEVRNVKGICRRVARRVPGGREQTHFGGFLKILYHFSLRNCYELILMTI